MFFVRTNLQRLYSLCSVFQVEDSSPQMEDSEVEEVAEARRGAEEDEVVAEEASEQERRCWWSHTDMKVISSFNSGQYLFYKVQCQFVSMTCLSMNVTLPSEDLQFISSVFSMSQVAFA